MNDITRYWIEKFNFDNIDKLNLKNFKNSKEVSFHEQLGSRRDIGYEADDSENIDIISGGSIQSGGSIRIIQNTRFVAKYQNLNYLVQEIHQKLIKFLAHFSKREI